MEISGEIFEQHLRNVSEKVGGAGQALLVESVLASLTASASGRTTEEASSTHQENGMKKDSEDGGVVVKTEEGLPEESKNTAEEPVGKEGHPLRYQFRFQHLLPMVRGQVCCVVLLYNPFCHKTAVQAVSLYMIFYSAMFCLFAYLYVALQLL